MKFKVGDTVKMVNGEDSEVIAVNHIKDNLYKIEFECGFYVYYREEK